MKGRSVIFVIADLGSGGAQQVLTQVANSWAKAGRRVGVLTLAGPENDFFTLDERVERFVAGGIAESSSLAGSLLNNVRRILALRRALKAFAGEHAIGFIAPTNILLVLAARGLGYWVMVCERNDPARQSFGFFWDSLRRRLYRRADIVSANSRGALETMSTYVSEEKLVWLPNPLRFASATGDRENIREPLILNVGRLHFQKGQDLLIRAFARSADQLDGWRLCILGEGGERNRLEMLIEQYGLGDRVELAGQVDDPLPWLRRASIFAFPSRWEGSPNALMEAMSCGLCPIVCDGTPGVMELVRDGHEGRVIAADDEVAFAQALVELAKNKEERERLGRAAVKAVRPFAPEAAIAAWEEVVWGQR